MKDRGRQQEADVVVVGAGNAAMCAALAAAESGVRVLVLESAPEEERGGNSAFAAGAMRFAYADLAEYREVVTDLTEEEIANVDFGTYGEDAFYDDMGRLTQYRCDPDLTEILVTRSRETLKWMSGKGVRFQASLGRQAFKVDGKFKFWGGVSCETVGGGQGLVDALHEKAAAEGVEISYRTRMADLIVEDGRVAGVMAVRDGEQMPIRCGNVVLACGGFEANAEMRARYLGPNWDLAKVRGSRFNNGDGLRVAMELGAQAFGHWSGAHAVAWELNAPAFGDLAIGDQFQKHSYPFGIVVNARGERFIDEGADFRNYTYAKYGAEIMKQPGMFAWQVFDAKVAHLLRDEYKIRQITKVRADTLEELARKMEGVDAAGFLSGVKTYNEAIRKDVPFNPNVKDGRGTDGLPVPKSNWANTIDEAPFEAYAVTCGVTFTFGGLKVNERAEVQDVTGASMPGLYAAGELVGGLFYFNYPGGSGLTSGAVFGRIAGTQAGIRAAEAGIAKTEIRARQSA
ncbi:FAD-dependent tricarballylate dehydrogenase TcuA [Afifella sp. IM 167]|uniref:FAD-dependent tricarballylate dehydrogenase TcuA n=1 Tax=Afifella sp. IM 167 TaxID=2033586 RepID=UPI001CC9E61A|nr:FAD-dependent tricarballylate dehydrogenase TcuA [Afifella sp. IM 167]MBZ8132161.1 tricarballylate dehydrogenase [Afifella sp. IM 167]